MVVKFHEMLLGYGTQAPPLPAPTVKFTLIVSGVPVEGVTVTVP